MKKLLASLCAVILGACGGGGSTETKATTAVIFGDSITEATGASLANTLGVQVTNLATSGETTTNSLMGTKTYGGNLLKYRDFLTEMTKPYDVVYLRYGMAEAVHIYYNRAILADFEHNLEMMVDVVKLRSKIPVVVGVSYSTNEFEVIAGKLNEIAKTVANRTQAQFVDVRQIQIKADDVPDGIHPKESYSQAMIQLIAKETKYLF